MLTSCGSSNPGLSSSTAGSADQAHCLSPLPGPLSLSPPRIPASCRNYAGIYPVPNTVTTLSPECELENILPPCCHLCSAPKGWEGLFSPQNRGFSSVLQKQASPPWPQRAGGSRVLGSPSSRWPQGRRPGCPVRPTPPLRCDSPHLSLQL